MSMTVYDHDVLPNEKVLKEEYVNNHCINIKEWSHPLITEHKYLVTDSSPFFNNIFTTPSAYYYSRIGAKYGLFNTLEEANNFYDNIYNAYNHDIKFMDSNIHQSTSYATGIQHTNELVDFYDFVIGKLFTMDEGYKRVYRRNLGYINQLCIERVLNTIDGEHYTVCLYYDFCDSNKCINYGRKIDNIEVHIYDKDNIKIIKYCCAVSTNFEERTIGGYGGVPYINKIFIKNIIMVDHDNDFSNEIGEDQYYLMDKSTNNRIKRSIVYKYNIHPYNLGRYIVNESIKYIVKDFNSKM